MLRLSKMEATKHILPNGLRVILVPRPESIAANILVLAEAGSKYETKEQNGLSHFLEHTCFKGTKRRPRTIDISSEFDALGAQYNAFTSQEYTGYWVTVQPKMLDRALDLVADMYLHPTFPALEVEKEKGVIIEEINMYEDLPIQRVQDLFMELLYGDQPAGWSIIGTKETVRALTQEDLFAYRRKYYVAPSTVVTVSGGFSPKKMLDAVAESFSGISREEKQNKLPVTEGQTAPASVAKHKPSDQTHLVFGFRSYPLGHPARFTLEVLAGVLGGGMSSRLWRRIRDEMAVAYYVRTSQDAHTDHGVIQTAVGADTSRLTEVVKTIVEEYQLLGEELVPAEELQRAKDSLIGNLYLGLEKSSNLGLFYGLEEALRQEFLSPAEAAQRLQAVTAEEIRQAARELFLPARLNLALIGPHRIADALLSSLSLR